MGRWDSLLNEFDYLDEEYDDIVIIYNSILWHTPTSIHVSTDKGNLWIPKSVSSTNKKRHTITIEGWFKLNYT